MRRPVTRRQLTGSELRAIVLGTKTAASSQSAATKSRSPRQRLLAPKLLRARSPGSNRKPPASQVSNRRRASNRAT